MNNKLRWTLGIAVLVAFVMTAGFATIASAQGPTPTPPAPYTNPWGYWGPGGMMGGYGPAQGYMATVPYGYRGRGMGPGMMGGWGNYDYGYGYAPNATPISLDQAFNSAKQYVAALNNSDLVLAEIEEYTANFYGVVKEKSTGTNAFQFLMDKYTGAISPEYGPSMMWNTKYSPMSWMHGGFWFNAPSAQMSVTLAHDNAAQYLKTYLPNTTVEDKGDTFYGYYNFDVLQNGKTYGMLSVNGYTGAVWYHTWHGNFVAAKQLDQ
ncbi:MAG: hypothetical protein HZB51_15210 [Chloroflexi bacterium]|nr:hypothetical protein [Chloroflexota bacterium]